MNTIIRKIKITLPFIILFALLALFTRELFYATPNELPSTLIGENIPPFQLSQLYQPEKMFTEKDLIGHVSLLNIWATWCYACGLEQDMLIKINNQYHIKIYGIDYKDNASDAKQWLGKFGDPYTMIGSDKNGNTAIDLGVYGTPETFIIDKNGKIVYRHIGIIDQQAWDSILYPLIKKYEGLA